jgi:hypothetical protein
MDATELRQTHPEDLLNAEDLEEYTKRRQAIWNQLVHLDTKTNVLRRINGSSLERLMSEPADSRIFWAQCSQALFDSVVLYAYRITRDTSQNRERSKRLHCLEKFRKVMNQRMLPRDYRSAYDSIIAGASYSEDERDVLERIESTRHRGTAHLSDLVVEGEIGNPDMWIPVDELSLAVDAIVRRFNAVSLGDVPFERGRYYPA